MSDLLANNGLAILFSMFALFVILPVCAVGLAKIVKWAGSRADILIGKHVETMDRLTGTLDACVTGQDSIRDAISNQSEVHAGQLERVHARIDEVKNAVVNVRCRAGESQP